MSSLTPEVHTVLQGVATAPDFNFIRICLFILYSFRSNDLFSLVVLLYRWKDLIYLHIQMKFLYLPKGDTWTFALL